MSDPQSLNYRAESRKSRSRINPVFGPSFTAFRPIERVFRRIILQCPISGAFQIIELAGAERPEKGEKADRAEQECRRHEPGKRGHDFRTPASRAALSVTRIDEVDITMAAISGVTQPDMAKGTAMIL